MCNCIVRAAASDAAIENAGFSTATIAITMPDSFTPQAGVTYDILVNMAVPTYTSGASMTIGGEYVYGKQGCYKRFPCPRAPFIVRVRYLADPYHYNFIGMRPALWTMCA